MNAQSSDLESPTATFADRIALLIKRVGSATQIARMCGFSEGVVRSWRDGNTDPSRARCITLARTLGISLVWLVAGEGGMQVDPTISTHDEQRTTETTAPDIVGPRLVYSGASAPLDAGVDSARLAAAMRLLQSELELSGTALNLADNMAMLAELYEIIGPAGAHADAGAMVAFNQRLSQRIQQTRHNV
ncbi:MAG: helix-turn-helix transcriptional regulator [Rhodanobacter sp.]